MLDVIRHREVFSPSDFGNQRVDIIGVGATGSRIALSLAKLGVPDIHLWDPDIGEAHNVPNQAFGNIHLSDTDGKPRLKVNIMRDIIREQTGTAVTVHAEKVDGTQRLGTVVFLLTDTMASRKAIFEGSLKYKLHVKLVVETRMGADSGRVYTVNPNAPSHVAGWEAAWYPDEEAQDNACRAQVTVGPTAEAVSGLAVWQFMRWFNAQRAMAAGNDPTDEPEQELVLSLRPMMLMGNLFE